MNSSAKYCEEPARQTPIVRESDVVVCGGGPAGVAAAIAAARSGARTELIEVAGCLGGVWTAGMLSNIIDAKDKPGIMAQIMDELERRGARATGRGKGNVYDPEAMKLLLEEMCLEAGVRVRLHTRVVSAQVSNAGQLTEAVTESKSGREAWRAAVFIDATGDGDLAARAGCSFAIGRESDGLCQPMSLMGLIVGIAGPDVREFIVGEGHGSEGPKRHLLATIKEGGVEPSYAMPSLFRVREDLFALMTNHQYGYSAIDADDITAATLRARAEIHRIIDALRSLGGVWSNVRVVATADQIGIRDGRRIAGRYQVSIDDVAAGVRHDDAVCRVNFCVDVHSPDPKAGKAYSSEGHKSQPYDIPYRAMLAKDVDGLLLAGRCISGDFLAHASYRVTGNSAALGQAAGVAAALAAASGTQPHDLPFDRIAPAIEAISNTPLALDS